MKHSNFLAAGAFLTALALPGYAAAQNAIASADVNMRAGPGTRFQIVATIPEDRPLTLHGCEQEFNWCDVSWGNNRGWVFADYIEVSWRGQNRTVSDVGPQIDLPIFEQAARQPRADMPTWQDRQAGDQRGERRFEVERDAVLADPAARAGPRADTPQWRDRVEGLGDDRSERRYEVERDAVLADPATGSIGPRANTPQWRDRVEGRGDDRGERRYEVERDAVLEQ